MLTRIFAAIVVVVLTIPLVAQEDLQEGWVEEDLQEGWVIADFRADAEESFARFDVDNNGSITMDEVIMDEYDAPQFEDQMDPDEIHEYHMASMARFKELDTDGDGELSKSEIMAPLEDMDEDDDVTRFRAQAEEAFEHMDIDDSGGVNVYEFAPAPPNSEHIIERLGTFSEAGFRELDTDGNGELSKSEVMAPVVEMANNDTNGDGVLSVDEMNEMGDE